MNQQKIVITGGAGLVGHNLVALLQESREFDLVVIDKHKHNLDVLKGLFPNVDAYHADCAEPGTWEAHFEQADTVVMLQAQIGSNSDVAFTRNNVDATRNILAAMKQHGVEYLVHISSSVVNSVADDLYTRSKREQENIVLASGVRCVVLRPTLMFGLFDRKHLGWLARFLQRIPLFPIPGQGNFPRQPLYAKDFCAVIRSCINRRSIGTYDISGREFIPYIELIKAIRQAVDSRALVLKLPFGLFDFLLKTWAIFDRDPPFTSAQLHALVAGDEFEIINWPETFDIPATPLRQAIEETFGEGPYRDVELKF